MYKMDIREGGGGWSKNRILGRTPLLNCKATKNYKMNTPEACTLYNGHLFFSIK